MHKYQSYLLLRDSHTQDIYVKVVHERSLRQPNFTEIPMIHIMKLLLLR